MQYLEATIFEYIQYPTKPAVGARYSASKSNSRIVWRMRFSGDKRSVAKCYYADDIPKCDMMLLISTTMTNNKIFISER